MTRSEYLSFRAKYEPNELKLIVIAESPPAGSGSQYRYFYKNEGSIKEPLFKALVEQIGYVPSTKEDGLRVGEAGSRE
jgi:hypothetical protein